MNTRVPILNTLYKGKVIALFLIGVSGFMIGMGLLSFVNAWIGTVITVGSFLFAYLHLIRPKTWTCASCGEMNTVSQVMEGKQVYDCKYCECPNDLGYRIDNP